MCGICGFVSLNGNESISKNCLSAMNNVMQHRGPDDEGTYFDCPIGENSFSVGLGHRRLSIIDLSVQGHQPMSNEDGSVWIVYNGEVYNFIELKDFLIKKGHKFKSHTDTEVIIHLYEEKGKECVNYLRGMFAFAIWDTKKKILFAARDRLGIKPFYYYYDSDKLVFASEVKSILKSGKVQPQVNKEVIDAYLTFGYVPAPQTMFSDIIKLQPGYMLTYEQGKLSVEQYWDINGIEQSQDKGEEYYLEQFRGLLGDCVKMRLISDVPLGVFLSGGIDSSTVVGLMSRMSPEKQVKTFCVGYKDKQSSELEYARIVAKYFNTEHHEFYLEPADFYSFIPKLVWHLDEPVVEAAAIPLYFISKLAHEYVTVLLSGEGADELFAGYYIYKKMEMIESYRRLPSWIRKNFSDPLLINSIVSDKKKKMFRHYLNLPLEERYLGVSVELTPEIKSQLYDPEFSLEYGNLKLPYEYLSPYYRRISHKDALTKMLYIDTKVWLPDDLLIKADKMSMATSVELRVPFLDYKLVEFAMSVPSKYKMHNSTTKYLLKKSVKSLLPKEIIHRKKKGFPVPINAWFKGDFSEKAAAVLMDGKSLKRGIFRSDNIAKLIKTHKQGKEDYSRLLFSLIMLEFWHNIFIDNPV